MWARLIGTFRSKLQHRPIAFTTASSTAAVQCLPFTRFCSSGANQPQPLQRWELVETNKRQERRKKGINKWNNLDDYSGEEAKTLLYRNLGNCTSKQEIELELQKYKQCRFKKSEDYFIALIKAYTGSYLMESAKEVLNDAESSNDVNHDSVLAIKNYLICQLAPRGEVATALAISTGLGNDISAEAAIALTHNLREQGQIHHHMKLLEILRKAGPVAWYAGFYNTMHYCIQHRMSGKTTEMMSKLHREKFETNEILIQVFGMLAETPDIDFALELYDNVKSMTEDYTMRAILISLQTCSMIANNTRTSDYVWSLYATHNLEYNISAYILRFRALYEIGAIEDAEKLLQESFFSLRAYQVKTVSKVLNGIRSKYESRNQE